MSVGSGYSLVTRRHQLLTNCTRGSTTTLDDLPKWIIKPTIFGECTHYTSFCGVLPARNCMVLLHQRCGYVIDFLIWHDYVIKWKLFPRHWPYVRGIHWSPVNSPHKGQWRGALMFSLICVWINGSVNNREAGYLRRYRAHYDVIVMDHTAILPLWTHKPWIHSVTKLIWIACLVLWKTISIITM